MHLLPYRSRKRRISRRHSKKYVVAGTEGSSVPKTHKKQLKEFYNVQK